MNLCNPRVRVQFDCISIDFLVSHESGEVHRSGLALLAVSGQFRDFTTYVCYYPVGRRLIATPLARRMSNGVSGCRQSSHKHSIFQ